MLAFFRNERFLTGRPGTSLGDDRRTYVTYIMYIYVVVVGPVWLSIELWLIVRVQGATQPSLPLQRENLSGLNVEKSTPLRWLVVSSLRAFSLVMKLLRSVRDTMPSNNEDEICGGGESTQEKETKEGFCLEEKVRNQPEKKVFLLQNLSVLQ